MYLKQESENKENNKYTNIELSDNEQLKLNPKSF